MEDDSIFPQKKGKITSKSLKIERKSQDNLGKYNLFSVNREKRIIGLDKNEKGSKIEASAKFELLNLFLSKSELSFRFCKYVSFGMSFPVIVFFPKNVCIIQNKNLC